MGRIRRVTPREPPKDKNLQLIFDYCRQKPNWSHLLLTGSNKKNILERMKRMFSYLHFDKLFLPHEILEMNGELMVNEIMIKNNGRNIFKFIKALGAIGVHVEDITISDCSPSMSLVEKICDALEMHCNYKPRFLELNHCWHSSTQLFITRQLWEIMIRQASDPQDGRSLRRVVSDWMPSHNYHAIGVPSHEPALLLDEIINEIRPREVSIYNFMTGTDPRVLLPSKTQRSYVARFLMPVMPLFYNELFETYHDTLREIRVYVHRQQSGQPYAQYRSIGKDNERFKLKCYYYPQELEMMEDIAEPVAPRRVVNPVLGMLQNSESESDEQEEPKSEI